MMNHRKEEMYNNKDFEAFATVTLTVVIERNSDTERNVIGDIIYALNMYRNTLPDPRAPDYVKEIILV